VPVVHDGGALGPLAIEALALKDGELVVRRAARLSFSPRRSVVLRLDLLRACEQRSCDDDRTCEAGECIARDVDTDALPSWRGRDGLPPIAMGGAPDASVPLDDAALGDDAGAIGVDAGGCGAGCECSQLCESRCECRSGCACDLTCPPGGDCEDVRCDGVGAMCVIEGRSASNLRAECSNGATCEIDAWGASNVRDVVCRGGATCDVDCRETSNCVVRCESGSSCVVRCDDGDDDDGCSVDCRAGSATSCADGVVACNRACP
jgi:hypothetical protein